MVIGGGTFRRLCRAREMLREVHEPALRVSDVARAVTISKFHFIRQFEALFGATPHQYRMGARLERAKILLRDGGSSVTEVCVDLGFSSLGSFSDLFRRRVGVAPSEFRRRAFAQVATALDPSLVHGCFGMMGALPADAFRTRRNFREA